MQLQLHRRGLQQQQQQHGSRPLVRPPRLRRAAAVAPPADSCPQRPTTVRVAVASPTKNLEESSGSGSIDEQHHASHLSAGVAAGMAADQLSLGSASRSSSPELDDSDTEQCPVFIDREGNIIEVMCCDYGFRSNSGRLYQQGYGQIPDSAWTLAWNNFKQEWLQLRRSFRYDEYGRISSLNPPQGPLGKLSYAAGEVVVRLFSRIDEWLETKHWFTLLLPQPFPDEVLDRRTGSIKGQCMQIRAKLRKLKLSNAAVWKREREREAAGGGVDTPWYVKAVYYPLCLFLDVAYENRPIQRFWFLECVARMPYFSYITMLHLYESFGWWRAGAELRKVHFAEEWNELHHLQIMESLGGDQLWVDRFMAQHAAIIYYWILVVLFVASPKLAYNFSELIEAHAVDTYGEFAYANEALLKSLPPPYVAAQYYLSGDYYLFDEFQTSQMRTAAPRKPTCDNLHDVFVNIRDDEGEHVKTMCACQDGSVMLDLEMRRETERRL